MKIPFIFLACAAFSAPAFGQILGKPELAPIKEGAAQLGQQVAAEKEQRKEEVFLVELKSRGELLIGDEEPLKLSIGLLAAKESGGRILGNDERGRPIIAVPEGGKEKLEKSQAVRSLSAAPAEYSPVSQLKLSYKQDAPPSADELKALGLNLVFDYPFGSFMGVQPVRGGQIDAALLEKLDKNPKILHVTAVMKIKAVK
jgi:hypothetical protein